MHYIVELSEQLQAFDYSTGPCFIHLITTNDNKHPALTTPCLLYYRPLAENKGYIIVIDHPEGFGVEFGAAVEVLSKHTAIYCLNSKYHSYFIDLPLRDINYRIVEDREIPVEIKGDTVLIHTLYRRAQECYSEPNKVIPISKIYEYWEEVYRKVEGYIAKDGQTDWDFLRQYDTVYRQVEQRGLKIDTTCFMHYFTPRNISDSYKDNIIYTNYNLYNTTMRPTNAFNSINFLAISKENESRKCFVPQNDCFVEFDFDGYHVRLIANLINYPLPVDIPIHVYFGQQYFKKEVLTEEEYLRSKQITFQNIYGKIQEEYTSIPFYKALSVYLEQLSKTYHLDNEIELPTGRKHRFESNVNVGKLFNYVIQNIETKTNVELFSELLHRLRGKASFINLIVYDSFLLDFSFQDGKELLLDIKQFFKEKAYTVKAKYGKNYHALKKSAYL